MPAAIEQSVRFSASARKLYDLYLDPRQHAAVTGAPVKISSKSGSKFSAFNGMISGVTQGWEKYYSKPLQAYLKRAGG